VKGERAMIIERHYDDEALIALMENERDGRDAHLPSCEPCSDKVESFRTIAAALEHRDVWDTRALNTEPSTSTIRTLRAFADRMSYEDAQAETYLTELLAGSRDEWMPRLQQHPEWRTAGVVRQLLERTTPALLKNPLDGLEMTALTTAIADGLATPDVPSETIARLRGNAWRERGYALFYVGQFTESLEAVDRADAHLRECTVDEYDRARVAIARALSLRAKEQWSVAMEVAQASAATFETFGDLGRVASARIAQAHLLFSSGEFTRAAALLEPLEVTFRSTSDALNHARILGNLGYCYWKLDRVDDALGSHEAAAEIYSQLDIATESARVRWNVASILSAAGRHDEAIARFQTLKTTFDGLGMASEASLVRLDLAELLVVRGEFAAVEDLCRAAMKNFEEAGISYTARALTALAYIREAAHSRTATPAVVKHVRDYLRRLPQEGELLFCPPPPEAFLTNSR
jgi:tetratricopeptide (TPR) repeat protein